MRMPGYSPHLGVSKSPSPGQAGLMTSYSNTPMPMNNQASIQLNNGYQQASFQSLSLAPLPNQLNKTLQSNLGSQNSSPNPSPRMGDSYAQQGLQSYMQKNTSGAFGGSAIQEMQGTQAIRPVMGNQTMNYYSNVPLNQNLFPLKDKIPSRHSSLKEGTPIPRKSSIRKDTFNDPFLGRGNGSENVDPKVPAFGAPLIALPQGQSIENQFGDYVKSSESPLSKYPALAFEESQSISYPRAYSPEPLADESNFADRYPSVEAFQIKMTQSAGPSPPIPNKPVTSLQQAPRPMGSNYRPQYMQPSINYNQTVAPSLPPKPSSLYQGQHIPIIPPKPSYTPLQAINRVILNANTPPPIAPKPNLSEGKLSPPLPPKPGRLDTTIGQHPFVLPSSPIGNKFGVSGLRNLGNTCFMNSVLQCLSATYPFARYFMDGSYRKHISRSNPLSSKGRVTEAYASVIRNLWSAEESVVVPSDFKSVIGEMFPSFAGNEQQDSQEFLSFLLDQLHEDLNVARRPFPPNGPDLDSENYPPSQFMAMEWQNYKARNWSIIVDMFQGILQSVLQCLACGKVIDPI